VRQLSQAIVALAIINQDALDPIHRSSIPALDQIQGSGIPISEQVSAVHRRHYGGEERVGPILNTVDLLLDHPLRQ
jgi:hypothetical protein